MDQQILLKYNGIVETLSKGEYIFRQGETSHFYYQIIKGAVRVFSLSEDGKEFTHKLFSKGNAIGIPPLFLERKYPSFAEALTEVEILKINKKDLMQLLEDHPAYYNIIIKNICQTTYYKSVMSSEISMQAPEHRIITLFDQLKTSEKPEMITLTRQQIANLTALRVETVIRHIKCMEEQGILTIKNRKVYY